MTLSRAAAFASRSRRHMAQARRFAILAAYARGEKAEYIAALHSVTTRLVHYYAKQAGIARPQGRPRKAA